MMPTTEWLLERGAWKDAVQAYLASIAFVDHQVGKVLDALERSDYAQNTIVVLWSDHGYHIGEKNRFAKQALWQESIRVPLIIKAPNISKTGTCSAPVQLIDMYPTLLELCGLPAYDKAEGHSLVPLLKRPGSSWKHHALSFYGVGNFAVTGKRYRLIRYEDGSQEFYDLKKDPNEWTNLAGEKKYQRRKARLEASIPKTQAPLAKQSKYNINAYFREIVKANQEAGN
jgi:arylsulfatase A-like enzyme